MPQTHAPTSVGHLWRVWAHLLKLRFWPLCVTGLFIGTSVQRFHIPDRYVHEAKRILEKSLVRFTTCQMEMISAPSVTWTLLAAALTLLAIFLAKRWRDFRLFIRCNVMGPKPHFILGNLKGTRVSVSSASVILFRRGLINIDPMIQRQRALL